VEIQDNASPNSYLSRTALFLKTLARTQKKITLDSEQMRASLTAINAYAITNKETVLNFTLQFQQNIECESRPCLMYFWEYSAQFLTSKRLRW
jgi:hypothetical protein